MPHVPPERPLVLEVTCRNIARSTSFYRALGFELVRTEEFFVELRWEGCLLFLDERSDYEPPKIPAGNVRILVPDVDACWQLCLDLGAAVHMPIENRYYGLRDFTVLDPDGFGIRFATEIPALA
ncbi:MAG: hypothetical protein QOJ65_1653 [Fimbriimonadaceae bacterium]|jgi:catechol 2,3-dioxygenase-like lactoylglutathione lyase family enzyme|nr:hypothetical protein [Fimbriimonadaceae bacterium]